mmetsp:Transcript_48406/g.90700  ORF Transcript_48406/g.90700 Transcript_48406/m.90700 type:complete len:277 (-) Transcript_48406:60-890(-)
MPEVSMPVATTDLPESCPASSPEAEKVETRVAVGAEVLVEDPSCPDQAADTRAASSGGFAAPASSEDTQVFRGEWDEEGVFFYQAFKESIAKWAVEHQKFGGPEFNPTRMTWIKPSFAWVLYRSGYACKHNQEKILKVKLSHSSVAELLSQCQCRTGGGGSKGRVQWDPERDLLSGDGREPRELLRTRAIQIGLKGSLSELYVQSVISIEDVTALARKVQAAHQAAEAKAAIEALLPELPEERDYMPNCSADVLTRLRMLPGGGPLHTKPKPGGRK